MKNLSSERGVLSTSTQLARHVRIWACPLELFSRKEAEAIRLPLQQASHPLWRVPPICQALWCPEAPTLPEAPAYAFPLCWTLCPHPNLMSPPSLQSISNITFPTKSSKIALTGCHLLLLTAYPSCLHYMITHFLRRCSNYLCNSTTLVFIE